MRRFLLVGLTGSIATGKSTVSRMFAHLGARVLDADQLAREVVMPGQPAYLKIVEEFGQQVVQEDGTLDRKALGAIVFADPARRKRLEEITHPAIGLRQQRILSVLDEEAFEGIVVWDVALLFETGGVARMDRVVVVYADPDTELARLMARDSLPEDAARARIASQMPVAEKAKRAHYVIDNSGSRADTERQVKTVYESLLAELKARPVA
ncbi:MAG TPA: dephospho-CoA kinase [Candidatus Bathyarchaeia archaeon]|nr:dephospho-CoA kinase [Candidatus Bathyarchaeia archaeon]